MAKIFSIIGDSISTFQGVNPDGYTLFYNEDRLERSGVTTPSDTWWAHVVRALGGKVLAVDAWSGSMVEGAGFPAASSMGRAKAVLGPTRQLLVDAGLSDASLLEANGAAPDVILCFIGINDYGWGGARAQAAGRSHAMPPCTNLGAIPEAQPGAAPANAAQLFGAAYKTMLQNLHRVAPHAIIYAIALLPGRTEGLAYPEFAYRLRGVHLDEYNTAIKQAVDACNQSFCPIQPEGACETTWDNASGLQSDDDTAGAGAGAAATSTASAAGASQQASTASQFRFVDVRAFGRDYDSLEGTHPTALGMRQFASMVVRGMQAADANQAAEATTAEDCPTPQGAEATTAENCLIRQNAAAKGRPAPQTATAEDCLAQQGATVGENPQANNPALDLTNFCEAPQSEEFCSKPSCIGCPYVTDTSTTWMCTCKKHTL